MTPTGSSDLSGTPLPGGAVQTIPTAESRPPRSIVLAIDGDEEGDSAVASAVRLADLTGARIYVVSVADAPQSQALWPANFAGVMEALPAPVDVAALKSAQLRRVRDQLARMRDQSQEWAISMRVGVMGVEVAAFAKSVDADLIVTGRGRHGVVDRLLGEEHLKRLVRAADVPILAAEPALRLPARRVIVAVDFSERTVATAMAALPYFADDAAVYLVHVKPDPPFGIPHPGQWIKSYEGGVRAGLERLRDQLVLPPTCDVEPIVLNGHPGVALADFARASRSDLIAIGAHGSGFLNRLVIGSVTTYLVRAAQTSLLIVPSRHS
jgi:nucleotide-binding universal stress UspA family protein